ncbi:Dynein assembly factor 1, axonemal [Halocaridina rubra]|uniref:Dynein axonemal assembly factor 1 homolog n=1 Tax=Halocaridina rubra TaxID=373956 RepID=A0AAN9A0T0_HALRR
MVVDEPDCLRFNSVKEIKIRSYSEIENLEEYTGLRCLWLENNAFRTIKGLSHLKYLRSLHLHHNLLNSLDGLQNLKNLVTLNVSYNMITKIDHISGLKQLETLQMNHNRLRSLEDISHLEHCPNLSCIDLSHNHIADPDIVQILGSITELRVVQLIGNPVVREIRPYRNTLITSCLNLTYLDDRPVFPVDRVAAEAWKTGGIPAERKTRKEWAEREQQRQRDCVSDVLKLRERVLAERAARAKKGNTDTDFGVHVEDTEEEKFYALTSDAKNWAQNAAGKITKLKNHPQIEEDVGEFDRQADIEYKQKELEELNQIGSPDDEGFHKLLANITDSAEECLEENEPSVDNLEKDIEQTNIAVMEGKEDVMQIKTVKTCIDKLNSQNIIKREEEPTARIGSNKEGTSTNGSNLNAVNSKTCENVIPAEESSSEVPSSFVRNIPKIIYTQLEEKEDLAAICIQKLQKRRESKTLTKIVNVDDVDNAPKYLEPEVAENEEEIITKNEENKNENKSSYRTVDDSTDTKVDSKVEPSNVEIDGNVTVNNVRQETESSGITSYQNEDNNKLIAATEFSEIVNEDANKFSNDLDIKKTEKEIAIDGQVCENSDSELCELQDIMDMKDLCSPSSDDYKTNIDNEEIVPKINLGDEHDYDTSLADDAQEDSCSHTSSNCPHRKENDELFFRSCHNFLKLHPPKLDDRPTEEGEELLKDIWTLDETTGVGSPSPSGYEDESDASDGQGYIRQFVAEQNHCYETESDIERILENMESESEYSSHYFPNSIPSSLEIPSHDGDKNTDDSNVGLNKPEESIATNRHPLIFGERWVAEATRRLREDSAMWSCRHGDASDDEEYSHENESLSSQEDSDNSSVAEEFDKSVPSLESSDDESSESIFEEESVSSLSEYSNAGNETNQKSIKPLTREEFAQLNQARLQQVLQCTEGTELSSSCSSLSASSHSDSCAVINHHPKVSLPINDRSNTTKFTLPEIKNPQTISEKTANYNNTPYQESMEQNTIYVTKSHTTSSNTPQNDQMPAPSRLPGRDHHTLLDFCPPETPVRRHESVFNTRAALRNAHDAFVRGRNIGKVCSVRSTYL